MKGTYWGRDGKYEVLASRLRELIPFYGEVPDSKNNKALERFRKASNAYYDFFNNGGINKHQSITKFFGKGMMGYARYSMWEQAHKQTEPKMDEIIILAAIEQKLIYRHML